MSSPANGSYAPFRTSFLLVGRDLWRVERNVRGELITICQVFAHFDSARNLLRVTYGDSAVNDVTSSKSRMISALMSGDYLRGEGPVSTWIEAIQIAKAKEVKFHIHDRNDRRVEDLPCEQKQSRQEGSHGAAGFEEDPAASPKEDQEHSL